VHGASLGGFHDDLDLGGSMSTVERMNTVPIKPKKPTLVGEDPYKAAESVYAKKQTTFNAIGRGLSSMDFNLLYLVTMSCHSAWRNIEWLR